MNYHYHYSIGYEVLKDTNKVNSYYHIELNELPHYSG